MGGGGWWWWCFQWSRSPSLLPSVESISDCIMLGRQGPAQWMQPPWRVGHQRGRQERKTRCSHVCQRWIYMRNKRRAVKEATENCMQRAGLVFSLRNSRLMQNKRASLNIQQEKLHSIWPLFLCGTTSFHSPAFILLYLKIFYTLYCDTSPLLILTSSCKWWQIVCPATADMHFTYSSWSSWDI